MTFLAHGNLIVKPSYRPDIDGLRGVALLGVVFCHAELGLKGGYTGVDVFFVISGYLIIQRIEKDIREGTFSLIDFWERRLRRIFPALFVMLVATLVAGWCLLWPDEYESLGKSMVGVVTMTSNVLFWQETGYFASNAELKPLLHTWSLALEEQFYLVIPLLMLAVARCRSTMRFIQVLSILVIGSLLLSIYGAIYHPSATFYLLPTRVWELAAGAILALSTQRQFPRSIQTLVVIVAFTGIALPYILYTDETVFPGLAAVPLVAATCLLIRLGESCDAISHRILRIPVIVFVGQVSYSFYLWHWPIFAFARHHHGAQIPVETRCVLVLLSFVIAIASWRLIENPVRNKQVLATRKGIFGAAGVAMLALLFGGTMIYSRGGFDDRMSDAVLAFEETGKPDYKWTCEHFLGDVPGGLKLLGNQKGRPRLLVWGDSHAMAVLPAIDDLCRERNMTAVAAAHSSTAPILDYFIQEEYGLNEASISFNYAVAEYAVSSGVKSVLLASTWWYLQNDVVGWEALKATIQKLRSRGIAVYILKTVPSFPFDVRRTLVKRSYWSQPIADIAISKEAYLSQSPFMGRDDELREAGADIIDFGDFIFGNSEVFQPFDEHGCYYYDHHHLSPYGARKLKNAFIPMVDSLEDPNNELETVGTSRDANPQTKK